MKLPSRLFLSAFLVGSVVGSALASEGMLPTATVIEKASATAKKEKKNVLVIFHASWCGWCKRLDAMLESKEFKSTFEGSYVIAHIDVLEQPEKKNLENPDGEAYMEKLGGKDQGLPFFAILSPDGTKLADSMINPKTNMGYPSEPVEVDTFMKVLKKTAPNMSEADVAKVEAFLRTPVKTGHR